MKIVIMGRESLMKAAETPFPEGTAVISITDTDAEDVILANRPSKILRLKFDDVSDEIFEELLGRKPNTREMYQIASKFHMLSGAQTQQIADFVLGLHSECVLICQCEYGQSRSAGVAAAVKEYGYGKGIDVFSDARYYPNKYVYRKLLNSLRMRGGRNDKRKTKGAL